MASDTKKLYIVTGKGGVGKTSAALAMTMRLNASGKKAKYLNFTTSSLDSSTSEHPSDRQEILLAKRAGVPCEPLNLLDCCIGYVSKKMRSETIAKFVVKTPFFKALINMIPGFNYLIYLGKALDDLNADPDLIYVLDSPSSGHAITMFEAAKNFADIFRSGLLFDDIQKMIRLIYSENFAQINALCLPTQLAANEAFELKKALSDLVPIPVKIFCNNSFKEIEGVDQLVLPDFLNLKLETERQIGEKYSEDIEAFLKHSLSNQEEQIIKDLVPSAGVLL